MSFDPPCDPLADLPPPRFERVRLILALVFLAHPAGMFSAELRDLWVGLGLPGFGLSADLAFLRSCGILMPAFGSDRPIALSFAGFIYASCRERELRELAAELVAV